METRQDGDSNDDAFTVLLDTEHPDWPERVAAGDAASVKITITDIHRPGPPGAPTDVRAAEGGGRLDVTWKAPVAGRDTVTGYDVQYSLNPLMDSGWTAVDRSGTETAQAITGLENGRLVWVRVRAVTADDGNGGTVEDITVRVKAAPVVASAIGDQSGLEAGATRDISLSGVFSDADGDALTITAASSSNAIATVSVAADYSRLTVEGAAEGTATVTVVARDSDGNRVSDAFDVSVEPEQETPEGAPIVVSPLPDISFEEEGHREISLPDVFQDPDGQVLTFSVESSDYDVVWAWKSATRTWRWWSRGTERPPSR